MTFDSLEKVRVNRGEVSTVNTAPPRSESDTTSAISALYVFTPDPSVSEVRRTTHLLQQVIATCGIPELLLETVGAEEADSSQRLSTTIRDNNNNK